MKNANSLFIAEVKKQQSLRNLTYTDLARLTGFSKSTIDAFMCGVRSGDRIKKALAEALEIQMDKSG